MAQNTKIVATSAVSWMPSLVAVPLPPLPRSNEQIITTMAWQSLFAKFLAAKNIPARFSPEIMESYCAKSANIDAGIMLVMAIGNAMTRPMTMANAGPPISPVTTGNYR